MQPRTLNLIVFLSVLLVTLVCGATAVWLVVQNPRLADRLFYTVLGLFTMGAGGIMALIRVFGIHRQVNENLVLPENAAPVIGEARRESARYRTRLDIERSKATRTLSKPPIGDLPHIVPGAVGRNQENGRAKKALTSVLKHITKAVTSDEAAGS
jgi:hypothetical protein